MMVDYIKTQLMKKTDHVGDYWIVGTYIPNNFTNNTNARLLGVYANR